MIREYFGSNRLIARQNCRQFEQSFMYAGGFGAFARMMLADPDPFPPETPELRRRPMSEIPNPVISPQRPENYLLFGLASCQNGNRPN